MILRVLIVDDEPLARDRLRYLLSAESEVEIVGEAESGVETLRLVSEQAPDLLFLDMQMPELSGLEMLSSFKGPAAPLVIFVTAHSQYAVAAFEANAVDYLLKPFDRERFQEALGRARSVIASNAKQKGVEQALQSLADLVGASKSLQRLVVRSVGRIIFVNTADIDWIGSAGNYAELHLGKTAHLLRETIAALQERLPARHFVRISRSVIVNAERIDTVTPRGHGDFVLQLRDGTQLNATRRYHEAVKQLFGRHWQAYQKVS
jgi:two-component system LytT family response regulator